ncbi:MAG TPA: DNA mismatch repair protein MutS [Candidatus Dormibacteraeota bacterium]|jgi:DNA mismatch repair protein MutS|nr:DNA mismatch repair protein MutS [Candidatus Dormibacteraeota bacterium]
MRGRLAAPHLTQPSAALDHRETIGLDEAGSTPILREYRAIKERFPDAVVLARLGDFYEMFGADAETAAPILGVALTGRSFGHSGRLNMCGVPHHAVSGYIRRLLDAGLRVALWDQVGTPGEEGAGKLVRREITRVLSPGMVLDDEYLEPGTAVRCVALHAAPGRVGVAAFDASTGELQMCEVAGGLDSAALAEECERLGAAELLLAEGVDAPASLAPGAARTTLPQGLFDSSRGAERLREATGTASLRGLGVDALAVAQGAAGAIVAYCERSRVVLAPGFLRVHERRSGEVMRLDAPTRRNLELLTPMGGSGSSLVQLLDHTRTPMGARLLRARLQEPLVHPAAIEQRLEAVAALVADRAARDGLRSALAEVRDLERLVGRCVQALASPRDLGAVRAACAALPGCATAVESLLGDEVGAAALALHAPQGLVEHLTATLVDEPPATARDGGAIRPGADAELDSLHAASGDARTFIATLEERERERTGIRSLKVGYNRVFGYYIEVPNAHVDSVPADYVRKQTLVGCERYITPQLKEQETVVLNARERALARETELLRDCAGLVAGHAEALLRTAAAVAVLDVAQALACAADDEGWVRPLVDDSVVLDVQAGRHPLVERSRRAGEFVPNDTVLDAGDAQLVILTGPNMAGKSTYLRQTALIVLLAQVGSFVPASSARIGVCDRIFTRVGAQDDLAAGLSTFMVEMAETAAILNTATRRSLVILDEIGRGTSTYDGLSIAQAVVEHLHDSPHLRCRTLFATHYHELTALAERLPRARNARVEVVEEGDHVTFLHRIVPGGADRSYGIHVARLAGVPGSVLLRARQLLADLEAQRPLGPLPAMADQLALPLTGPALHPVVEELQQLDLDGLSPLAALNKLAEWRERIAQ